MAGWDAAKSVLAVRLDGMGDLLMTTPALRALKEGGPERRLTVLTSPAGYAVARDLPFVDEAIAFRAPWVRNETRADAVEPLLARLRDQDFDAGVVFTVCTQNPLPAALLLQLARVPLRAAYCRENPYELLTDWLPDPDRDLARGVRHEVRRQLDLVAALGSPARSESLCYPVTATARAHLAERAAAAGLDLRTPFVALHPGASAPSRRYPIERFAAVAATLAREGRPALVVVGGAEDRDAVQRIAAVAPRATVFVEPLDLPELAALLSRAEALVCNNSGPAHLAAAVGTPVVDLYALTNPQHAPWGVPHRLVYRDVECRWCLHSTCPRGHHACLADVAPVEVVRALDELLAESEIPAPRPALGAALAS